MTTSLAADVHDAEWLTNPAERRRHLRQLAEQVEQFTCCDVRRAVSAWTTPSLTTAERTRRWSALVADVQLLQQLDGVRDRPAYTTAVAVLERDITRSLDALVPRP